MTALPLPIHFEGIIIVLFLPFSGHETVHTNTGIVNNSVVYSPTLHTAKTALPTPAAAHPQQSTAR